MSTPLWEFRASAHAPIPPPHHPTYSIPQAIQLALAEDAGTLGDVTTLATIPAETQAVATFLAKAEGVLAGLAVADLVFSLVDPTLQVSWSASDGSAVQPGVQFGVVRGSARSILVAERIALNFMQRMSGIATATAAMVQAMAGTSCRILETRKTVPGLRLLDKWAVLIGGGANHRMGLYDMMMIKDNHVAAAGGIGNAVQRAEAYIRQHNLRGMCIEVETRTLAEVDEVIALLRAAAATATTTTSYPAAAAAASAASAPTAGTDSAAAAPAAVNGDGSSSGNGLAASEGWPVTHVTRVMLDNMVIRGKGGAASAATAADSSAAATGSNGLSDAAGSNSNGLDVSLLAEAVGRLLGLGVETEASGNVTLESVGEIARTGVSFVSCGALTHSVTALDISLKIATQ